MAVWPLTIYWKYGGSPRDDLACMTEEEAEAAARHIETTWANVEVVQVEEPSADADIYEIIDGSGQPVEEDRIREATPPDKVAHARKEFFYWAERYRETGSKADLLAVGQYYGMLCAYHEGAVPGDIEKAMGEIVSELAGGKTQADPLREAMDKARASESELAAILGMSVDEFRGKAARMGGNEFTVEEASKIASRLHLDATMADAVFFGARWPLS